ncbi:MAG: sporulation protein YabP [Mycoplasmatota bacterium]
MDNKLNSHVVTINDRKSITISGVKKVENCDEVEFLIETILGFINILGSELELINLDNTKGNILIKGNINEIVYLDKKNKKNKKFISKLLK